MSLTIIGDVHSKYLSYLALTEVHEHTLQLGDMGFDYKPLLNIDYNKHKFHGGNHDNYDIYYDSPNVIQSLNGSNDYGVVEHGGVKFFFIRGGHSIDKKYRRLKVDYWSNEELNYVQMEDCYQEYLKAKPDIVISHEVPTPICHRIGNPGILIDFGYDSLWTSQTAKFLESLRYAYKPKMWIHGHFHKKYEMDYEGTKFIGLAELGTYTIGE